MTERATNPDPEEGLFQQLAALADDENRKEFLERHPQWLRRDVVAKLAEGVQKEIRVDLGRALGLAEAALFIARRLEDKEALARGLRAKANALYARGQNQEAVALHEEAAGLFESLGQDEQLGRTLSSSLQPLILLGEYERATAAAERAHEIFSRLGDARRLARLEINVGNILHRQDRFDEAQARYERAYQQLSAHGDAEGMAAALSNMAVCLIMLNDFPRALALHQRARDFCEQEGMTLPVVYADYNIAYLYYLRGNYSQAIERLKATREACRKIGESYQLGLCSLDLSDIYLELNLSEEAAAEAQEGLARFQALGTGYEAARSLTNIAIATGQRGKAAQALELFDQARAMFVREKNPVWPALIDLYRALVLFDEGRFDESRRSCRAALEFFESSILRSKAILCRLLQARLAIRAGELDAAGGECRQVLTDLARLERPLLSFQAHFLMGQIQEARGDSAAAYESYQAGCRVLETLRSSLHGEELRIAFIRNKAEIYESLVALRLSRDAGAAATAEVFDYIERAKSRSLMELMAQMGHPWSPREAGQGELGGRIRELREELHWFYQRIELERMNPAERAAERIGQLEKQVQARESELLKIVRDLPVSESESAGLYTPGPLSQESIRAALGSGAVLVEYFFARDDVLAGVLNRESFEIISVARVSQVQEAMRGLQFQLSKFRLGAEYARTFEGPLLQIVQAHLRTLGDLLLAPLRERLQARHLIFVPHGVLHQLPFHALYDGERYLIDSHTVSYAPSASVYALCVRRPANSAGTSLILGVPDQRAPFISEEVQAVAGALPQPELFVGESASEEVLREKGPRSRLVHIATHGHFRQDSALFSGIRLGTSYLNLYDLYQLRLPAELVTLSGCATGVNVVAAGDELLGLVRGLLYAGAQSLLLTLWDVNDRSTTDFMKAFYRHFGERGDKSLALQAAMREVRERYPHPYHWAPFVVVGKALPD